MAHMMPIFKRGSQGTVMHRMIGAEQWPIEGWYDSPSKVPLGPGQTSEPQPPEPVTRTQPRSTGPVHGEPVKPKRGRPFGSGKKQ